MTSLYKQFLFYILVFVTNIFLSSSCVKMPQEALLTKPQVLIMPSEKIEISKKLSAYYQPHDLETVWGREMACGWGFTQEGDFYRAITCFRKAIILFHAITAQQQIHIENQNKLYLQATTGIITSYVLSDKYAQAIDAWSTLQDKVNLQSSVEAKWLLILLVQAYSSMSEHIDDAISLVSLLPLTDPDRNKLFAYLALRKRSIELLQYSCTNDQTCVQTKQSVVETPIQEKAKFLFTEWDKKKKNAQSAAILNLLIPGTGYAYLGQYPTACTSIGLNALFIGSSIEFLKAGYPMAGLISLGLEIGWWGGGITGVYLQTEQYNHKKWVELAEKFMKNEELYPEKMLWNNLTEKVDEKRGSY